MGASFTAGCPADDDESLAWLTSPTRGTVAWPEVSTLVAVVMEADHYCMHWRGVKDDGSKMTNSVMRGRFLDDPALRREFLSLRHRG